jgi:hypothetical protein
MLLIQRMAQQGLDDRLTADIQVPRRLIEFLEHGQGKVHIDALNGRHHLAFPGEKTRDVLAAVGEFSDLVGGRRFMNPDRFRHRVQLIP